MLCTKTYLIDNILNKELEIYVLGRNKYSRQVINKIAVTAVIDDFSDIPFWEGLPVVKLDSISNNNRILIIICSLSIYPLSAIASVEKKGIQILTILDLYNDFRFNIKIPFFKKARLDYINNEDRYLKIREQLNDQASKEVLNKIINFRNTGDFGYLKGFTVNQKDQYFSRVIDLIDREVFVDAGGFDGQTTIEFISRCRNYHSIYIFEPSAHNLEIAKKKLGGYPSIYFSEKGVSNKTETLKFKSNAGSASAITPDGCSEIQVDSIDNLVYEPVTFIKMDIEGAESLAIEGAKNHILNSCPKMAIAVYHKPDDLWRIPEQVLSIRNDYNLYLRHYTEGMDETIMYFIPKTQVV